MADNAHLDRVAAHRPYGLDCKCGRPINSDKDWARHIIEALELTEESVQTRHARAHDCGDDEFQSRLVGPWRVDGEGNQ